MEASVLTGLRDHFMDLSVCEIFCEEYTRHLNELRMERNAASQGYANELDKVTRDLDRLVQAVLDGVPGSRVAGQEARKAELEALLAKAIEEPVLLHPNLGQLYWQEVARLVEALNYEHHRNEATETIRD